MTIEERVEAALDHLLDLLRSGIEPSEAIKIAACESGLKEEVVQKRAESLGQLSDYADQEQIAHLISDFCDGYVEGDIRLRTTYRVGLPNFDAATEFRQSFL